MRSYLRRLVLSAVGLASACSIDYDAYRFGGAGSDAADASGGTAGVAGGSAGVGGSRDAAGGTAGSGAGFGGAGGRAAAAGQDGAAEDASETDATPDASNDAPDEDSPSDGAVLDAAFDAGCAAGTKQCGASCVALDDPAFGCSVSSCAACDLADATAACVGANCVVAACSPGFADCNTTDFDGCEVDTRSDEEHCGGCTQACSLANATAGCVGAACTLVACQAGFADCDLTVATGCEADTQTSTAHCGVCGNACPAGWTCQGGQCSSCPAGTGDCDGVAANGCETNTSTSAAHCGACLAACSTANAVSGSCLGGQCAFTCSPGFADCNGPQPGSIDDGCEANLDTDALNCGGCGDACSAANNSARTCAAGRCSYSCNGGFADCNGPQPGSVDDGCETNVASHPGNCGGCGVVCAGTNGTPFCTAGVCGITCDPGFANCDGSAANGCEVALATSVAHCGACGAPCSTTNAGARFCNGGGCTYTCSPGFADCNGPQPGSSDDGCETNVATSPLSCGACGVVCDGTAGTPFCAGSTCGIVCNTGFASCDGSAANGCEVALATDTSNCGSCGGACSAVNNSSRTCALGACSYTCNAGFADCNGPQVGASDDGCETSTTSDPANCGGCSVMCAIGQVCQGGACVSCPPGQGDCDANPGTGCETNVTTSTAHCGSCGGACSTANNTARTCAGGACSYTCVGGFADCNGPQGGAVDDGCESNTQTSIATCGGCGAACSSANGIATCTGGACQIACAMGFDDCDLDARTNGCEVSLWTNSLHCGSCGGACSTVNNTARTCSGGSCNYTCTGGFADCNGPTPGATDDGCEVNTLIDPTRCGSCSNVCNSTNGTAICSGGTCGITCNPGFADCDGNAANGCEVNLATNVSHCGACAAPCSSANNSARTCAAGLCTYTCTGSFRDCNGPQPGATDDGCEVNVDTSTVHCGACGDACSGANGAASCAAGSCSIACAAGFANCNGNARSDGCEANLLTDTAHCGSCSAPCSTANNTARTCSGGMCSYTCTGGFADCNGPQPGATDDGCEVNTSNDVMHCGSCGGDCSTANNTARVCSGGTCSYTCTAPFANCNGAQPGATDDGCEANTSSDVTHCGSCGGACSTTNNTARTCSGGTCSYTCSGAFADCNGPQPGATDDGCEVDTATNVSHCGSCGGACSTTNNTARTCSGGTCSYTCSPSFGDCNGPQPGNVDDGCELNVSNNVAHCGSCNAPCSTANNGSRSCASGVCTYSCNASYSDCNGPQPGAIDDGCEAHLPSSVNNCGSCGTVCSNACGSTNCVLGSCVPTCSAGCGNCDGNAQNGCEVTFATNVNHCGSCGRSCSSSNVASRACSGGLCTSSCDLGFGNCTLPTAPQSDDGCERNVQSNDTSCGGCGNSCTAQGGPSGDDFECDQGGASQQYCGCSTNNECRGSGVSSGATCNTSTGTCSCNGTPCGLGQWCISSGGVVCSCNGGPACGASETCCQTPAGCRNLSTDASSCGACGRACPPGFSCVSAGCRCATNAHCDAGGGGTCTVATGRCVCGGSTCGVGERCQPGGGCG